MSADNNKNGMTLVEVMIAMLILAMTLGGGVTAITTFSRAAEAARRRTEAVHQARVALEHLSNKSYGDSALSLGAHTLGGGLVGSYQVTPIPASQPFSSQRQVDVFVPWTYPGTSRTHIESLTTIVSEALRP